MEKPVKHYLTKRAELTSPITRHIAYHLSGILAKIAHPHFNLEKISDKPILRDILQNNWSMLFKCQGHEKQRLRELLQMCGDMTTKCNMEPWIGFWNRERA